MSELKFVAAGFLNDAEELLRVFIRENSMEFSIFAEIWKKHNFSLIYAGRPNGRELREFTLEIFHISINFLESGSLLYQVGGIFLLYALYRNQILSPPLKIRITLNQFKIVLSLIDMSRAENYRSLHYVISYLVENSFDFVACPKLKGPNSIRNEVYKEDEQHPKVQESDIKYELTEIVETNVLHEIDELFISYNKSVDSLNNPFVDMTSKHPSFRKFARQIDELLTEGKISDPDPSSSRPKKTAIGSRRALLKAAAFSNPVSHYLSHDENNATTSCVSDEMESAVEAPPEPLVPAPAPRKRRPFRRGRRKVGRPKKLPADRLMSATEVPPDPPPSPPEQGSSSRRRRRPRGQQFTRIRHYYAEESVDSDDLMDVPSTSDFLPKRGYVFSSDSYISE